MLLVTLAASRYAELLALGRTVTERTYADMDLPPLSRKLATLSGTRRSSVLRQLVRSLDMTEWHPGADYWADAEDGTGWVRDGKRIGIRTGQLRWESSTALHPGRWCVRFGNVPRAADCDELLLALFFPHGVHIVRHEGKFGLAKNGHRTGSQINVYGPSGIRGWTAALELFMLPKLMASGCGMLEDGVAFDHPAFISAAREVDELRALVDEPDAPQKPGEGEGRDYERRLVTSAYAGLPLHDAAPRSRAAALGRLVRAVDERLHPDALFQDPVRVNLLPGEETRVGGADGAAEAAAQAMASVSTAAATRGGWQIDCSWRRDGARVVCRSAMLLREASAGRWRFLFSKVKLADSSRGAEAAGMPPSELLLALYSPAGVHIYRHGGTLGLTRMGRATVDSGEYQIKLHATRGEADWRRALEGKLLPMLDESETCERVAFVDWAL